MPLPPKNEPEINRAIEGLKPEEALALLHILETVNQQNRPQNHEEISSAITNIRKRLIETLVQQKEARQAKALKEIAEKRKTDPQKLIPVLLKEFREPSDEQSKLLDQILQDESIDPIYLCPILGTCTIDNAHAAQIARRIVADPKYKSNIYGIFKTCDFDDEILDILVTGLTQRYIDLIILHGQLPEPKLMAVARHIAGSYTIFFSRFYLENASKKSNQEYPFREGVMFIFAYRIIQSGDVREIELTLKRAKKLPKPIKDLLKTGLKAAKLFEQISRT